jgi:ribosomal protein S12 methylthiotransferase accessory factor
MPEEKRLYKSAGPADTVHRIREILRRLDIDVYEKAWRDIEGKIFSCQINLEDLEDLTTYGKGKDARYALASAYAEMMERVQNLMIFSSRIGLRNRDIFSVFNDSREYPGIKDLLTDNPPQCRPGIEKLCAEMAFAEEKPVVGGTFYDVGNDCLVRLPYAYMIAAAGSNGMCAGNDGAEALVQGFCEIMEREALKAIYTESVIPPDVPVDSLKDLGTYEMIRALEGQNVSVSVKDCSLGKGYPVIGVLLVNRSTGRYRFRLGSHTIFNYAVERSITEAYQGFNNEILGKVGDEVELGKDPFRPETARPADGKDRSFIKSLNYLGQLRTGSGKAPATLFDGAPTYPYTDWSQLARSASYAEDLRILQEKFLEGGSQIYIRDVSFLGFPSYWIYITGLSPIFHRWPWQTKNRLENVVAFERNRKTRTELAQIYSRLDSALEAELADLIGYIEANLASPISDYRERQFWLDSIFFYRIPRRQAILQEYLLALLYYKTGRYGDAFRQMGIALQKDQVKREKHQYYHIFRDALYFLSLGVPIESLASRLSPYYAADPISGVLKDMQRKDRLFEKIPVPDFSQYESSTRLMKVFSRIRAEAAKANLDQMQVGALFQASGSRQLAASGT